MIIVIVSRRVVLSLFHSMKLANSNCYDWNKTQTIYNLWWPNAVWSVTCSMDDVLFFLCSPKNGWSLQTVLCMCESHFRTVIDLSTIGYILVFLSKFSLSLSLSRVAFINRDCDYFSFSFSCCRPHFPPPPFLSKPFLSLGVNHKSSTKCFWDISISPHHT